MELFYPIVLFIAVVLLILVLTFMGILLRSQNQTKLFPNNANICPDYWTSDLSGNCTMPTELSFNNPTTMLNTGSLVNLGTNSAIAPFPTTPTSFSTTNPLWGSGGASAICQQKQWSNQNNIVWDGISNYNSC